MRLACCCLFAVAACNPFKDGTVAGRVESKGVAGTWVFDSGTCFSGQREQYHGVIGYGPEGSGIAIKLVKDGVRGWTALINRSDTCKAGVEKSECKAITLAATDCTTLDAEVETTNTTVNDIKVVVAKLTIDCAKGDDSIKGQLTFDRCH